ncbi:sugar ABC transporter substrate-binding protein [Rhizobium sp. NZLR3b]|uniref:ABC transporter substrate-binding protein n=1 Tax=Rhizobium sp. NZLR3b TaxID=2731101 RepID=UPI001C82AC57|nr:sugar ABC transporter substrate-binding protein [Rhizobium sp. NZLR3b]MBX5193666.1 sugar ABC transporter substrate-binding protein [Rhizobium sp. NZLR3b]
MKRSVSLSVAGLLLSSACAFAETTVTIGTVNNSDMVVMQELSKTFEKSHPDIKLNWVVLEENVLRQKLTTDITTSGGQFDVMTIGLYEAPMWGKKGWLQAFDKPPASYQIDDVLKSVRDGLAVDGKQVALPFYAESQMTFYRKDLFEAAGLTMPAEPTWKDIAGFAEKLNKPDQSQYGICLRGKPGWGENVGQITPTANGFGARWFDMDWKPQLNSPEWKEALTTYTDLLKKFGPPGAASNGFNENLALFASGNCAMWIDATVAASFLQDPNQSTVIDKVGYAMSPYGTSKTGYHYLWAWALAVPTSSKSVDAAQEFVYWATSPEYIQLVAKEKGWGSVPPGTRNSTYASKDYKAAAPFADVTLKSIESADLHKPTRDPVPYYGIGFVGIPEFQAIGTTVGQNFTAALTGQLSVDQALDNSQKLAERAMKEAGYIK